MPTVFTFNNLETYKPEPIKVNLTASMTNGNLESCRLLALSYIFKHNILTVINS